MLYQYAYLIGSLVIFCFWVFVYRARRDLRKEILWASFLGLPFGILEYFFVPFYWNPESLFDLMRRFGFGIEGFLYSFSIAGIAAVGYEFLESKKLKKISGTQKTRLGPFILFVAVFLVFKAVFPAKPMLDLIAAFSAGAVFTTIVRPDLLKQILTGGAIFGFFYFIVFAIFNSVIGDVVARFYSPQILGNYKIVGVPLEEIIGAFTGGAFWSTIYEYTKSYKTKNI